MKKLLLATLSVLLLASCGGADKNTKTQNELPSQGGTNMEHRTDGFSAREEAITKIAALSAVGEIGRLTEEMESALAARTLSRNEIGEICLQLYAYAGFPRSLNAQNALSAAVKSLSEKGTAFDEGNEPEPVPSENRYDNGREIINYIFGMSAKQGRPTSNGYETASDVFLKEHLFNDITSRANLSVRDRELATVSMLAALGNVNSQLAAHINGAMNTGTSASELSSAWIPLIAETISLQTARNAEEVLSQVAKTTSQSEYKMTRAEFERLDPFGIGDKNPLSQYFIGNSYLKTLSGESPIEPIFNVTFEPGCRNNWHIHHASSGGGQVLICTAGSGWYQEWGKEPVSLEPGTVIVIPANTKHWHGAKKDSYFSHVTFEPAGTQTSNEWLEPVEDEEYGALGK